MSPTTHGSDDPSSSPASGSVGRWGRSRAQRPRRDAVAVLIWSALLVLVALGLYYGWRTTSNRDQLTDRNLRELDRMGRTVEARLESFFEVLGPLARDSASWESQSALIPDFVAGSLRSCRLPGIRIDGHMTLCTVTAGGGVEGTWTVDPLRRALDTELFDAVFLAAGQQVVLLTSAGGGLRVDDVPADTLPARAPEQSTVRSVTIAGSHYQLFLQPLHIPSPAIGLPADTARAHWSIGALVATARFNGESLSLGTRHLLFLGALLLLAILSLPFLRVMLMGRWEHVNVMDVYLLSLSLVLMSGLLGLALGDLTYDQRLGRTVDGQLAALATQLNRSLHTEVRSALGELVRRSREFQDRGDAGRIRDHRMADSLRSRVRIFPAIPRDLSTDSARVAFLDTALEGRYLNFQMVFWTDPAGEQVAKWTPRGENTRRVAVDDRPYYTRIREGNGWSLDGGEIGLARGRAVPYYLQSLRSKTTGEHLAALSLPFCWSGDWSSQPCPRDARGVAVIIAALASIDQPVLPPGVQFAIVDPDGQTLFHSRPDRNLDEDFFEETGGDPTLRSLVAARVDGRLNAVYMGRPSRLQVQPITGTPLTLVLVHDDRYLGTVHFQTLFLALALFAGWVVVLWLLFVFMEFATPGRLQWAWPARGEPQRYRVLLEVLAGFALVLVVQGALAIRFPVHPSSLLVPVQAMALGFLVLSKGRTGPPHITVPVWRRPTALGWSALALTTVLQILLHWPPGWHLLLLLMQLAVVGWGCYRVLELKVADPSPAASQKPVQRWYVAAIALALVVLALLPGCLFYQEAFAEHLERLVRYEQVQIVEGMQRRADRVRAIDRQSGFPEVYDRLMLADPTGLAFQPLFRSTLAEQSLAPLSAPSPDTVRLRSASSCRWERGATLRHAFEPLIQVPAWYVNDVAAQMGNLTRPATDGYDWTCSGNTLQLRTQGYVVRSQLPGGLWLPTEWWVLGLIGAAALLLWAPTWLGRRIFLLSLDHAQSTALADLPAPPTEPLIIVCTRSTERSRLLASLGGIPCCDLLDVIAGDEGRNEEALRGATEGQGPICLDHFDQRLHQESWTRPLLARLEHLIYVDRRVVVLLTSREPSALFPRSSQIDAAGDEETHRWVRLLGQFVEVRIAAFRAPEAGEPGARGSTPGGPTTPPLPAAANLEMAGGGAPGSHPAAVGERPRRQLREVLEYESETHPFLLRIAAHMGRRADFGELTPDTLVDQIREMADSYYHALWSILEREEKLVIAQLAAGVVVNPRCERAVRHLLERGILVRAPELRLMNESFARFVREEVPPATVFAWERERPASAWQRIRFPILLAVGAVAAFLFTTQRPTFDAVIAILSTAAVGTTAAVRLFSVARSSGGGG